MVIKTGGPTGDVPAPTVRAIIRAIRNAGVLFIGFPRLERAFIVDTRTADGNRPAAFIANLAFNAEMQLQAVRAVRPDLPPMDHFVTLVWGGSTRAFAEQGVLPALLNRLPPQSTPEAMTAFEQLRQLERGTTKTVAPVEVPDSAEADDEGEIGEGDSDPDVAGLMDGTTRDEE